jgi:hypothetical protein
VSFGVLPRKGEHEELDIETVPKQPVANGLVKFRTSDKWYTGSTASKQWHNIPFIDKKGMIRAISIGRWYCHPAQLLASIASTVFKRLRGNYRHISRKYRPRPDLLFRVALYYAITNDDSFFLRCHAMLTRARVVETRKFAYYHYKHLGKYKRFLFDQALSVALWLQSRKRFCVRRELPTSPICRENTDRNTKGVGSARFRFDLEVTAWARVYSGACARPTKSSTAFTPWCESRRITGDLSSLRKESERFPIFRGKPTNNSPT